MAVRLASPLRPAFASNLIRSLQCPTSPAAVFVKQESSSSQTDETSITKKPGFVQSLLHGSEKAKAEGALLQSHSTTVGRREHIHEIQKHRVYPHHVDEYKKLVEQYFAKIAQHPELRIQLRGSWEIIIGPELDTFVHIWEFDAYSGYDNASAQIRLSPEYAEFMKALRPLLQSRSSQICREFAFWPCAGPRDSKGGIYEMRSYSLKPGTLLEWEVEWRRGLEARKRFVEPIGAWFSQVGRLHTVHHMWQYENLHSRLEKREKAWEVDAWGQTVSKTVKMCDSMDANILIPLSFSPLR